MTEYINRTKFEELMRKKSRTYFDLYYADKIKQHHYNAIGCNIAADEVMAFPSADVQPVKRGRWIETDYGMFYECSECGNIKEFEHNFCDNCGARMDLKDGDAE